MKIVILNQGKQHHKYLISKLSEHFEVSLIIVEKNQLKPAFNTYHFYEEQQDLYEKEVLLSIDINQYFESSK